MLLLSALEPFPTIHSEFFSTDDLEKVARALRMGWFNIIFEFVRGENLWKEDHLGALLDLYFSATSRWKLFLTGDHGVAEGCSISTFEDHLAAYHTTPHSADSRQSLQLEKQ